MDAGTITFFVIAFAVVVNVTLMFSSLMSKNEKIKLLHLYIQKLDDYNRVKANYDTRYKQLESCIESLQESLEDSDAARKKYLQKSLNLQGRYDYQFKPGFQHWINDKMSSSQLRDTILAMEKDTSTLGAACGELNTLTREVSNLPAKI